MNAALNTSVPKVREGTPLLVDLSRVAFYMREDERDQWCAFRGLAEYDPEACARDMLDHGPATWALYDRAGAAFFVGGFTNQRPGVWTTWAAGTDRGWALYWREITRHARRAMDALMADGAHRIEVISLADRPAAGDWYARGLGMTESARLRRYAADGRDAICYARIAEETP